MKKMNKVLSAIFTLAIVSTLIAPVYHAAGEVNTTKSSSTSTESSEAGENMLSDDDNELGKPHTKRRKLSKDLPISQAEHDELSSTHFTSPELYIIVSSGHGHNDEGVISMSIHIKTESHKKLEEIIYAKLDKNPTILEGAYLNGDFLASEYLQSDYCNDTSYSVEKGNNAETIAERLVCFIREIALLDGHSVKIEDCNNEKSPFPNPYHYSIWNEWTIIIN